jgi:hypothetical protein
MYSEIPSWWSGSFESSTGLMVIEIHSSVARNSNYYLHVGFMMSFCPNPGIDLVDFNFQEYLRQPGHHLMHNQNASIFALLGKMFHDGVKRWHRKTVEWLVVYLATEAAVTPHGIRNGHLVATYVYAYQELAIELVSFPTSDKENWLQDRLNPTSY